MNDLIAHYSKIELSEDGGKRTSTREVYEGYLRVQIAPKWGQFRLDQVKTVAVEGWLKSLDYAPGTLSKIRNIMSALFAHAKRYGMIQTSPIEGVRCSSKTHEDARRAQMGTTKTTASSKPVPLLQESQIRFLNGDG